MPYAAEDNDNYARETVSCDNCGEEHTRPRYRTKNRDNMYCSRECHTEHILERGLFHDEDSPLYEKPADGEYGDNWDKIAKEVRKRDNYTCQACGKEQSSCDRKLDVHHVVPLRKFNDPKKANEFDNLIALCRYCHNKWEGIPLRPQ
jgi:5-methylcytosine-specific restriction endonuclease McrA